jgi:hypothetical protein
VIGWKLKGCVKLGFRSDSRARRRSGRVARWQFAFRKSFAAVVLGDGYWLNRLLPAAKSHFGPWLKWWASASERRKCFIFQWELTDTLAVVPARDDGKDLIQASISDCNQRTVFGPRLRGTGKVPSAMRRYMVELPSPVFSFTSRSRNRRSSVYPVITRTSRSRGFSALPVRSRPKPGAEPLNACACQPLRRREPSAQPAKDVGQQEWPNRALPYACRRPDMRRRAISGRAFISLRASGQCSRAGSAIGRRVDYSRDSVTGRYIDAVVCVQSYI